MGSSSSASAWAAQVWATTAVSRTDRPTRVGTTEASCSANSARCLSATLASTAWTWPEDSSPDSQAPDSTGSTRSLCAVRTAQDASREVRPARRSQAVIDVAPSASHPPEAATAPTAAETLAASR